MGMEFLFGAMKYSEISGVVEEFYEHTKNHSTVHLKKCEFYGI